ncbi:MAG: FAD-dependent oxidoreductase, partial [Candidatus Thorarchaeota archaeon SMTZ1-83]
MMSDDSARVGVFVCHCGLNIAGTVDCPDVAEFAGKLPGVVHSDDLLFACSDDGQENIKDAIKEHKLNRVVVASCTPRTHEPVFRACVEEAGLNPYLYDQVNLREHVSWCHMDQKEKATKKAKDLVAMSVQRVKMLEPLQRQTVPVIQKTAVIGAGVAGISAALDLANAGFDTYLIEKRPTIGGQMALLDKVFPQNDCSICILGPIMSEVGRHPRIHLLSYSEVESVEGYVGNFTIRVREKSRYIDLDKCNGCGLCETKCPSKVTNEYEFGLAQRKAIYRPFPQAVPSAYTIDPKNCRMLTQGKCGVCAKVCPTGAIDYDMQDKITEIEVGTIVVATGFDIYDPSATREFGFSVLDNVITNVQLERLTNAAGPTYGKVKRPSDGETPRNVAFVQCVGSRDRRVGQDYCCYYGCENSFKQATQIKEKYPQTEVAIFATDVRTHGLGYEGLYRRAREMGVVVIKGRPSEIEEDPETKSLKVLADDLYTGERLEITFDLVVLASALHPNKDTPELARRLNVSVGEYGFFMEAHPKLRPVDSFRDGVFLAGACLGPMDIPKAVAYGKAAAAGAQSLMA